MTTAMALPIEGYRGAAVPNHFERQSGEADHLAILLPGFGYTCDMPLFFYAQNLLEERGADVLRVEYAYWKLPEFKHCSDDEQRRWLLDDAAAAFRAGFAQRRYRTVTLIGKSFGTLAAGHLLTMDGCPDAAMNAVWLTPLLRDEVLREQLRTCQARSFIAIGSADPYLDAEFLQTLRRMTGAELMVVDGADHGFDVPGDVTGSIAAVAQAIAALERFISNVQ